MEEASFVSGPESGGASFLSGLESGGTSIVEDEK